MTVAREALRLVGARSDFPADSMVRRAAIAASRAAEGEVA